MNIIFTRSFMNLRMGGVTIYVKQLIKHLDDTEFSIINLVGLEKKRFLNAVELVNWSNVSIKRDLFLFFITFPFKIIKHRADVVHLNPSLEVKGLFRDGFFLLIGKLFNLKSVVFIHGWNEKTASKIKSCHLFSTIFKMIYNRSDIIVVLANEFKHSLREIGLKTKIIVETTMVDDEMVPIKNVYNKCISSNHSNKINILFLARIERSKGIYEAIDTFVILRQKYSNIRLIVAGDGNDLSEVKKYVDSIGSHGIDFIGYISGKTKEAVLLNSDIYLFPTTYGEGMPISLLEAMALGNAVITRYVGGIPDIFINGKNGFITDSKSPDVYARLIEKMILDQSLLRRIGMNNFNYAQEYFFASKVTKRIESIYLDL
ncbi:glycosyltransferase family 4 protein [Desulfoluna spongiiphila]|uniref:Glycosyltransferase involved in cell wall bisynthesis n=1 Tax=Desulfoluna spongiiphila TaxID=419481 RepID=A0A1G5IC24_9BACT|nr:glycosyltransferase family 4 protein [Desulfoluna spongiiphila]SCY73676.1 Glycosyltransferase involved in cell wall bisynthesis [Desulfoluna spongiiphila]